MALEYSRSVDVVGNLGTVLDADADGDNIYLFTRSGRTDSIWVVNKDGAVQGSRIPLVFGPFSSGVARVGMGYAVSYANQNTRSLFIEFLESDGSHASEIQVGSIRYLPSCLIYREDANDYVVFGQEGTFGRTSTRAFFVTPDGTVTNSVQLFPQNLTIEGVALTDDRYWVVQSGNVRTIPEYDTALAALTTVQNRDDTDTEAITALAYSAGELIVITGSGTNISFSFYGEPDVVPVEDVSHQQLFLEHAFYQSFALTTDSDTPEVKSFAFRALQQSDVSLIVLPGTLSLEERFGLLEIIPEYTIPNAKIGDKVFLYSDETTAPTEVPDTAVTIKGVISAGGVYRQVLVCER